MSNCFNDIKYAFRQLRKSLGFTVIAVMTLGLGIGATTTLFGTFKALVLDPFPYPQSHRIAHVWSDVSDDGESPLSASDFLDLREQNTSFSELGAYRLDQLNLGHDTPESVGVVRCTAGVLRTFDVQPVLGRWLLEADEHPGAAPVVVISYSLWKRVFRCDPQVLEQTLRLDGRQTDIVGVMPAHFEFHTPRHRGCNYEVWTPLVLGEGNRGRRWLLCVGRLEQGITLEAARTEIKTIGERLAKTYPASNRYTPFHVRSHREEITRSMASTTWYLLGAVTLLLLVACANIAGMLLARGTRSQPEFGVRLALGATRWDVVRFVLCESMLIALLGGCVGVLFAMWGLPAMRHLIPTQLVIETRRAALQVDGPVLVFSIGMAFITALLFGLLPALTAARTAVVVILKETGRSQTGSKIRYRFLRHLVIGQIALALVLTNSAILLSASYLNVLKNNEEIDSEYVLPAELTPRGERYNNQNVRQQFWDKLIECIEVLPGVEHVAMATNLPLEGDWSSSVLAEGEVYDPAANRTLAEFSTISPDYFSAMGIAILRGRAPLPTDNSDELVGIAVNQTLVNKYWTGQDPIGKLIRANNTNPWFQARIVGVVSDVRQWGAEYPVLPQIYFPCVNGDMRTGKLIVRTTSDAHGFVPLLRQELAGLDSDLPLANLRTMKQVVGGANSRRRLYTLLIDLFMGAALVLTVVGIYGTLSYNLLQRKREMGIRIAFGARYHHIMKFVFRQAGLWVAAGLIVGLTLTAAVSFLLRSMVYNISPWNPLSLLLGLSVIGVVSCLACLMPAIHAMRIDPMEALRYE